MTELKIEGKNVTRVQCSFCEDPIEKDRYCFALEGERQDVVPSGFWQHFTEHPKENVCSKCYETASRFIGLYLDHLRANKGVLKNE